MTPEETKKELDQNLEEAKKSEETGDFFVSAHHYKKALELARNSGDSELITKCKSKLVEMNQKAKGEFKELKVEQTIPNEEIDNVVKPILEGELKEVLKKIGACPFLCPRIEQVEESAGKSMPISYQIADISVISENGHLVKGGGDAKYSWLMSVYGMQQSFIDELYIKRIFDGLFEKGLDGEKIWAHLLYKRIFPKDNLEILASGIDRYFAGDYVSALHILIPQFESVFLNISERIGIDVVSLNSGKEISTQTKTLSAEKLDSETFQKVWGKNFCAQIKFALFEPLGYKLRHKIAHGEITKEECTYQKANLVLYFYLVLVSRVGVKDNLGI